MGNDSGFPKVLIVEDDVRTAEMLEMGLVARGGFDCVIAHDGIQALGQIKKQIPDVILLDLCLPGGLNGFDICKQVKQNNDVFIPVIMLTAMDDVKSKVHGLDSGADDYITKPYDIVEVVARLNSILRVKDLQNELIDKNKSLEELNMLKDEFLSMCSHDLRNIIMPIMEASSLMRDNLLPDSNLKFSDIIYRQSKKMSGLLNALLKSFNIEQGKLVLNMNAVNVNEFIDQYVHDCMLLNDTTDVEINSEIRQNVNDWVFDSEKIDEVLTNLISNAIKFSVSGGKITVVLDKYYDSGEEYLMVSVRDTGEGIPKERLESIFEKFVSKNSPNNDLGMGLGLSICKNIVEAHGGKIWVKSEEGIGSEFSFIIPKLEVHEPEQVGCMSGK